MIQIVCLIVTLTSIVILIVDRRRNKSIAEFNARRSRIAPCPINANHDTSPFSSTQDLWCHDCRLFHPWPLKPGQAPLITNSRDRGIQG